ncbi:MAG: DDE-type integrase/transposase/recombinase, partial [Thermotogota bacterium]|nr:DDE-type integrase/transposase/recombinase [Thermotogota bacterium]
PLERSDKNKSRKMTPEMESLILEERAKHPERSCQLFYEQLCARGKLLPSQLSYASVYRYLKRQNLLKTHQRKEGERKRFGYEKINILWQGDTMHGPYIRARGRKTKTYLVAIIDDCSRIIPYATFMIHENATGIARVLKEAIARRGIPKLLYFDNGSPYRNDIIACACAQLGINLVHTPPYTPQAKGYVKTFVM